MDMSLIILKFLVEYLKGSVLGPFLFLIDINDLQTVSKFLPFCLFADDTNIYFGASDTVKLPKEL